MPEIDHRVGEGFEGVVQSAEAIKAKQQPPKLVLPSKHSFNRSKSFFEYFWIKQWLGCLRLVRFLCRDHFKPPGERR